MLVIIIGTFLFTCFINSIFFLTLIKVLVRTETNEVKKFVIDIHRETSEELKIIKQQLESKLKRVNCKAEEYKYLRVLNTFRNVEANFKWALKKCTIRLTNIEDAIQLLNQQSVCKNLQEVKQQNSLKLEENRLSDDDAPKVRVRDLIRKFEEKALKI